MRGMAELVIQIFRKLEEEKEKTMDTPDLATLLETHKTELSSAIATEVRKFRGLTDPNIGPQPHDFLDGIEAYIAYLKTDDINIIQNFYAGLTRNLFQNFSFSVEQFQGISNLFVKHMKLLVENQLAEPENERTRLSYLRRLDRLLMIATVSAVGTSIKGNHPSQSNDEPKAGNS